MRHCIECLNNVYFWLLSLVDIEVGCLRIPACNKKFLCTYCNSDNSSETAAEN